jgi:hypothetical protein
MAYDTGVRLLERPLDSFFVQRSLVEGDVLTVASSGAYLDPHLVVLATLLTFWLIYIGLRIRDVVATAI